MRTSLTGQLKTVKSSACVHAEEVEHPYKDHVTKPAKRAFTLAFQVYCERCKLTDFVKISNTGWQGGKYADAMSRGKHRSIECGVK